MHILITKYFVHITVTTTAENKLKAIWKMFASQYNEYMQSICVDLNDLYDSYILFFPN